MTSGHFYSIPIDSITIPPDRQRKETPSHLADLSDSIRKHGLIQPITVDRDHVLVAGYCRTIAVRSLGWTHISAQYHDELTPRERFAIEFEENERRENLSWQDRNAAIVQYFELCKAEDPAWNTVKHAEVVNIGQQQVSRHLIVAEEIKKDPTLAKEEKFSVAVNRAQRNIERRRADESIHIYAPSVNTHSPIQIADFNEWAPAYSGSKFNFIHCDFPYGIEAHKHAGQNSSLEVAYTDSAETYWTLFKTLSTHLDRFCAESAHMIFWFSPTIYCNTWEYLKLLDGFRFDEHPLIWQRGENEGIAPDPQRRPRRIYEMAFFGWRGDRKIIRTRANSIIAPTERERHPHEKSELALQHFFGMCVDENTRLLDPTCGSGSALRAAKALGAKHYLGLELNEEYARRARESL